MDESGFKLMDAAKTYGHSEKYGVRIGPFAFAR